MPGRSGENNLTRRYFATWHKLLVTFKSCGIDKFGSFRSG
jgi:hypothetical protein